MKKNKFGLLLILGLLTICWFGFQSKKVESADDDNQKDTERRFPVVLSPIQKHTFDKMIKVQGNVEAKNYADVSSRLTGTLDNVFVDEGDLVEKDKTKLFQVDRENLLRTVKLAEQDLSVSKFSLKESQASLKRINADLEKSELDYGRFKRLFEKKATTKEILEQQESRYKQTKALSEQALAIIELNKARMDQAKVALEISRKNLRDSTIKAPIDGVITQRLSEPGEMAESGKTVVRIEDLSILEISTFLPAETFALTKLKESQMRIKVAGMNVGTYPVTWKSPTINPMLRTFEIKCILKDPPEIITSGAIAEIEVVFSSHDGLGVPREAVQIRSEKPVVFLVENGRAKKVLVETGLLSSGWLEVKSEALKEGMEIVSAGQYMIENGSLVTVQKEEQ